MTQDLALGAAKDLWHGNDRDREPRGVDPGFAERHERGRGDRASQNDEGYRNGPGRRVRGAHDGRILNIRTLPEHGFEAFGLELDAAEIDHVVASPMERHPAVGVDSSDIARIEPAVAKMLRSGLLVADVSIRDP